jgi:hypothetical protein
MLEYINYRLHAPVSQIRAFVTLSQTIRESTNCYVKMTSSDNGHTK